jgi:hypothetical protein
MLLPLTLAAQDPQTLTGNVSLVADYRFRGLSQTYSQPAIQGGVDYAHPAGFYVGTWGSNVSGNQFLNGGSLELDVYGGYRGRIDGINFDAGLLYYWYPGARYNIDPGDRYNTAEAYLGATYGPFTAKYSHALTNLFGLHSGTIGNFCGIDADGSQASGECLGTGPTSGSGYIDLSASLKLGTGLGVGLHFGRQFVRNYEQLSYSDFKVSVSRDVVGVTLGVAAVGTDAEARFYRFTPTTGGSTETENVAKTTLVLSLSKTF